MGAADVIAVATFRLAPVHSLCGKTPSEEYFGEYFGTPKILILPRLVPTLCCLFKFDGCPRLFPAESVAGHLKELYEAGLDGVLMVYQAYHRDTLRFERGVMPWLREMGVIAK